MVSDQIMPCWIYASDKKEEMYVYVTSEQGVDELPDALMEQFGPARFVMQLELGSDRKLARVDTKVVMASLREKGFFLQMPPELKPELYHGNED